jgi:hypothetical protein
MHDSVQFLQSAVAKSEVGEAGTIEMAVMANDLATEARNDLVVDCVTGLHDLAAEGVSFDDLSAKFAQHRGNSALA